ncbi:ATP-binding cassette domain-containing protein [Synechococcales cyanobacterium C]|uniref:ATP-binding cassette domain-containing protein n=1 Tax=Petrachloros mirabilis ULC683 TaxID=2781853 RepID=A0A8K2A9Q1_9CYAN|nr:ABC transporter ATP-binding protein [Petrachloros mirabilis]NCJ08425.1 ATP-binding cassette domain-containing protein [Petrachloros mirabilis ULC683]
MKTSRSFYTYLLTTYLSPYRLQVAGLALTLLTSIGLQVFNPQLMRGFIDAAVAGVAQRILIQISLGFIAIALVRQALVLASTYLGETIAWHATNTLRLDLVRHTLHLDLPFHATHTPGELIERVDGDVDALSRFFSQFVIQVLGNGLLVMGILGVLWWEDWRAGLGLSVFAITALGLLSRLQVLAVEPWRVYRQMSAEFYGFVAEHLSGLEDLRANGATGYVRHRLYGILRRWLKAFHRARLTSTALWGGTVGVFTVGNAIALSLGAYLWNQNAITIGTVYLLFYYTTLLQDPIEQIRAELEQFQQAAASLQRIQHLLKQRSQLRASGQTQLPQGALSVAFKEVWFSYQPSLVTRYLSLEQPPYPTTHNPERATLQNLTFRLPPGQVLGLLGHTGSGKSTLARLLLRLYDIQAGQIYLGGVNISQVSPQNLTERIGFVTQDVQLFQTSVRNNLTFFNPHISDGEVLQALEDLGLMPWLIGLPYGLDTELGEDRSGLSAGQAQLLAFARVFLKNPGLVILDEASSRLDPLTEQLIEQGIDRLLHRRTGVIIAHRVQTVMGADQILILEQGKILEYGDRRTLMANPQSHFARLYAHAALANLGQTPLGRISKEIIRDS